MALAISTPVGPAPTRTNVNSLCGGLGPLPPPLARRLARFCFESQLHLPASLTPEQTLQIHRARSSSGLRPLREPGSHRVQELSLGPRS